MCTVNIKVDDVLVRRINPGLSSRESINKWLQEQVNAMIEEMAAEDTVDLETAREMTHRAVRREYALDRDMTPEQLYAVINQIWWFGCVFSWILILF